MLLLSLSCFAAIAARWLDEGAAAAATALN